MRCNFKEGTSVSAKVGEGLTVQTLDKNLKIADDNTGKLIDIQSTSGAKPTAEAKASQDIVKDRGNDYFDQVERQSRNREDKEMSRLVAEKESNIIEDDGRLNNKGQEIIETQTQTPIENTKAELNALGGKEEVLDTKSKEAAGKIVEDNSYQNNSGDYLGLKRSLGEFKSATDSGNINAMEAAGGSGAIKLAAYQKTLQDTITQGESFDAISKLAVENNKSHVEIMKDIESYKADLEKNKDNTSAQNTKDPSTSGIAAGIKESAINNAGSDAVKSGELNQPRADNNEKVKLTEALTKPEVLQKQAQRAGMSVEEYLRTQDQKPEYRDKDGADIKLNFDKDGNITGRTRTIHTNDGLLLEEQVLKNGEFKNVKKLLDGSDVTDQKHFEDYSFLLKFSSQIDHSTGNINPENFTAAEKLKDMKPEERRSVVEFMTAVDIAKNGLDRLHPAFGALSPLAQSFIVDAAANMTDTNKKLKDDQDGMLGRD